MAGGSALFADASISENLTIYPGLESGAGVIIKSETSFTNPVSENLDLALRYVADYSSRPSSGKKNTDTQFIAGLKYKF